MNILNLDYMQCHCRSLMEIAVSGHTVYDTLKYGSGEDSTQHITETFGVKNLQKTYDLGYGMSFNQVSDLIHELNIDCLIVSNPNYGLLHTDLSEKLHYIGPSYDAAQTEVRKFETRTAVESLGIKVAPLIDNEEKETFPRIVKPKSIRARSRIVSNKEELESLNLDFDYYTEEMIDRKYEIQVFYTIFEDQHFLRSMHLVYGEENNKRVGFETPHWYKGVTFDTVPAELESKIIVEFEKFVDWVKQLGGKYEGEVTFIVDKNEDIYFIETNARNGIFNSNPIVMPGYDWLTGLTTDFSVYAKPEYENVKFNKISVETGSTNDYPLYLHGDYDIDIPANLFYSGTQNNYFMNQGLVVSTQKELGEFSQDLLRLGLKVNI